MRRRFLLNVNLEAQPASATGTKDPPAPTNTTLTYKLKEVEATSLADLSQIVHEGGLLMSAVRAQPLAVVGTLAAVLDFWLGNLVVPVSLKVF